jgi:4-carboxymuconolactone decarboxylase
MMSEMRDKGLQIRRDLFGAAAVDHAMQTLDPYVAPLHDIINEFAFGTVWGRDGLPRKTRSLLTIAMLCAMNRRRELKVHIRTALTNGCSREEIREVLLLAAVYAGIPAALDAHRVAIDTLSAKS